MTKWFEGFVNANGIKLHYTRTGGNKPVLVIVHGITDMGITYSRVARVLEQDYDVIMYDWRGHGLSEKPETGYAFQDHAADLVGLISALNLENPRVIGHSGGAASATLAAVKYPDLMACLILEDPCWGTGWGEWDSMIAGMRQWFLSMGSKTREDFMAEFRQKNPGWEDEEVALLAETKVQVSPYVVASFDEPEPPWRDALSQIKCPILLIIGDPEKKGLVTPSDAQEMAGYWRNGKIVQIDGAGHMIHFDRYEQYLQAVQEFLVEIDRDNKTSVY